MENTVKVIDYLERAAGTQEMVASQVQEALSEIFKSTSFRASKQSQQLLQYIVDQTLAGHAELLKERIIGAAVFGRPPDYDTNEDPIVRGRAAEVRKRLAQYYATAARFGLKSVQDPTMPRFPIPPRRRRRNRNYLSSIQFIVMSQFFSRN
jgi:hypothetical protein